MITDLEPNQIFVFGANIDGAHGAGAAKFALDKGWTRLGHSHGLLGQSFAINTMSGVELFKQGLRDLIITADRNPALTFILTPVGQGIAGYSKEQVQDMLDTLGEIPKNIKKVGW